MAQQYQKPQYRQIRDKHIHNHWIRANTFQNTGKYVHNTYQYHRCSPETRVLRWSWIHTKTYQKHTNSYKYTQTYIPIRARLSTCGGNLAVVLVCIVACIDVYLHANISWYIPILLHDRTGGIGMYCVRICPYFGMYLIVFSGCICVWYVLIRIEVFGIVAPKTYWSMYWYVLICIGQYLIVLVRIDI